MESSLSISLLHEIMHLGWQYEDPPHWRGVANQSTYEAAMNGAEYDYAGEVVRQVNAALVQRGLEEQQRSSYQALLLPDNLNNAEFQTGVSYTGGALVGISRIGFRGRDDNMDISARTDGANALMFGLDGNDTLVGNRGNDFLCGGDNNDILVGGAGNDQLWGGTLNESGRTDGTDTARYQSVPGAIVVHLNGSTTPTITVRDGQGGTDTLQSIEIIQGSSHADTLVLQSLTASLANSFDYIDFGAGQDIVDVSALSGVVMFNPTNPADQTLTVGDAVLHLRNIERINGNQDTLVLDSSAGARVDGAGGIIAWAGSSLLAYANFAVVVGGEGSDRMYGGSEGHYIGGGGTNYIEGSANAVLESASGDTYFFVTNGGTIISGAGNDFISVSGNQPISIQFGAGSGHDILEPYFQPYGDGSWALDRQNDLIILNGLSSNDIELIWNFTDTAIIDGVGYREVKREGEAAIRIKATGETLYLGILIYNDYAPEVQHLSWKWPSFPGDNNVFYYKDEVADNDSDDDPRSLEMDIFSFDGVNRLNLFDLFDLGTIPFQVLPPEAKSAADILSRVQGIVGGTSGNDTLNGTSADDDMIGGAGNDSLTGDDGADFIRGDAGADIVMAGLGNDAINGGVGDDTLDGGAGDDVLDGGEGNDKITGSSGIDTVSYASANAGVTVNLTNSKAQNTIGAGTDTLATIENVIGSASNDTLTGSSANNQINGGTGNDTIDGAAGDDVLIGGGGNDLLTGGNGIDTASYSSASAGVAVSLAISGAQNTAGAGIDTLSSIENIVGTEFADALTGSSSANVLTGGAGNDELNGGAGADKLNGGLGTDILTGGSGNDIFVFDSPLSGNFDTIADFDANNNDKIHLDDAIFAGLPLGALNAANFLIIANSAGEATNTSQKILYDQSTGDLYYDADGNGAGAKILFAHINLPLVAGAVNAADFLVV